MIMIVRDEPVSEDPPEDLFHVHPDNWQAFTLFQSAHTQWRVVSSMSGAYYPGLDYSGLRALLLTEVSKPNRRRALFQQIRLLEAGALSVING